MSQLSLYKYFLVKDKVKLPHPTGPLSLSLSYALSAIVAANREVTKAVETNAQMDSKKASSKRGEYAKFSPAAKIELAKYAAQHGVAATLKHYAPKYLGLKEITVRTWRDSYTAELSIQVKRNDDKIEADELPAKKRGRSFLLGEDLDRQVRTYLTDLQEVMVHPRGQQRSLNLIHLSLNLS